MNERSDRIIPLIISTILYFVTTYIIFRFHVPNFLKLFFLAIACLSFTSAIINFWWRISLYSIGAGTILALVLVLSFKMYTPLLWYLIPSILVAGLILSAGCSLTVIIRPVWAGFLTGFLGFTAIMMYSRSSLNALSSRVVLCSLNSAVQASSPGSGKCIRLDFSANRKKIVLLMRGIRRDIPVQSAPASGPAMHCDSGSQAPLLLSIRLL